jgi:transcriptional regulator with XRE-family HTH domain
MMDLRAAAMIRSALTYAHHQDTQIRETPCNEYTRANESTMPSSATTFGQAIASARKAKGLSQKELAAQIVKDEDNRPISPQYLNDIEHDRRSPTSDYLIRQFAKILNEEEGYLFVLAGKIPDDLRKKAKDRDKIVAGFANFRKTITK